MNAEAVEAESGKRALVIGGGIAGHMNPRA
jgi:hypothetical protein